METIRGILKHWLFSLKKSLTQSNYKGCKFIYAHYWNSCTLPSARQLEMTKDFFGQLTNDGWKFISLDDIEENHKMSNDDKKIFLSFDDGFLYLTKYWHPIAEMLDIKYTIFINPKFIEDSFCGRDLSKYHSRFNNLHKPADWDDLKKINNSNLCNIESHGMSHRRLSELEWEQFKNEVDDAHTLIKQKLNKECKAFAWPYGTYEDVTDKQIEYLKSKYNFVFAAGRKKQVISNGVINRDHFELSWPSGSIEYLLERSRTYPQ